MKQRLLFLFAVTLILLVSLCACTNQPEEKDPSVPSTNVQPTDPTPTETAPPTAHLKADYYSEGYLEAQGFTHYCDFDEKEKVWVYTGESATISLPHAGIQLTIPDAWAGKVTVYLTQQPKSDACHIYVASTALMDAYADHYGDNYDYWKDCVIHFWRSTEDTCILYQSGDLILLGCTPFAHLDPYYYYYFAPASAATNEWDQLHWKYLYIDEIGQEAYDAWNVAFGGAPEEVSRQIFTLTEANPDLAYAD